MNQTSEERGDKAVVPKELVAPTAYTGKLAMRVGAVRGITQKDHNRKSPKVLLRSRQWQPRSQRALSHSSKKRSS